MSGKDLTLVAVNRVHTQDADGNRFIAEPGQTFEAYSSDHYDDLLENGAAQLPKEAADVKAQIQENVTDEPEREKERLALIDECKEKKIKGARKDWTADQARDALAKWAEEQKGDGEGSGEGDGEGENDPI